MFKSFFPDSIDCEQNLYVEKQTKFKGKKTFELFLEELKFDSPNIEDQSSFSEIQNTTRPGPEVLIKKNGSSLKTVTMVCFLLGIFIMLLGSINCFFICLQYTRFKIKTKSKPSESNLPKS